MSLSKDSITEMDTDLAPNQNTSMQLIVIHFAGLLLALLLNTLRKSQTPIPILGVKVGMVGGLIPAECVVLSLLIARLALMDPALKRLVF
ncbi:hypothetical protein B0J14DRAFT_1047 [Halenospora varia]|nr:hypothetical protein B0J14DRAFT_1047 [Halenospora varia]